MSAFNVVEHSQYKLVPGIIDVINSHSLTSFSFFSGMEEMLNKM